MSLELNYDYDFKLLTPSYVCCACLCSDRKLNLLYKNELNYFSSLLSSGGLKISDGSFSSRYICWECRANLRRMMRFQAQAIEVQSVFLDASDHSTSQQLLHKITQQFKTKLSLSPITIHDFNPVFSQESFDVDTKMPIYNIIPDEIKEEDNYNDRDECLVLAETIMNDELVDNAKCKVNKKLSKNLVKVKKKTRKKELVDNKKLSKVNSLNKYTELDVFKNNQEKNYNTRTENDKLLFDQSDKIFKRSSKSVGYSLRPIDGGKFKILSLNDREMLQSRLEDAGGKEYLAKQFKCEDCILGFIKEKQYMLHIKKKHDLSAGPFPCDVCHARFASPRLVRAHRKYHFLRFECRVCGARRRLMRDMLRHYSQSHGDAVYTCQLCGLGLRTAGAYRYHREGHKEKATCDYCGRSFQTRAGLFSHIVIHMNLPRVSCTICHRWVRNKHALGKHMSRHAQTRRCDAQQYCASCDIYFQSKYSYEHHLKTSLKHVKPEELRYPCSACDKRFYTEKRRTEHYNSVHLKQTEFRCPQCLKSFCNKNSLRVHIRGVHERLRAPRDKICDHCGKAFYSAGGLRTHVRTHTGERPYACAVCGAAFAQCSSLRTHSARVHPTQLLSQGAPAI